jgi:hypothetical protein
MKLAKLLLFGLLPFLFSCEKCAECSFNNCYDCSLTLLGIETAQAVCSDQPGNLGIEVSAFEVIGYTCEQNNSVKTVEYCEKKDEVADWKNVQEGLGWTCKDVD